MRAALKAQVNKTDRNDARGIAQMMGVRPLSYVKTLRSQKLRMLLTHRKLLQSKAIAIENDLRATLRNFGLKVGAVGTVKRTSLNSRPPSLIEDIASVEIHMISPFLKPNRSVVRSPVGEWLYETKHFGPKNKSHSYMRAGAAGNHIG